MSDELAVLRGLISENPRQRIGELRIAMQVRTGESFTYPTLYRGVRDKPPKGLGYTHKKLTAKARQADAADEAFYLAALATEKDPSVFLFLDETGVSEKEPQRRYGLGPPGKDIIVRDLFQERQHARGVRHTAILALNINGFVVPACSIRYHKHDEDDDDPDHGNMTGESFADYVANDLLPYLGNYEEGETNSVVCLDNWRGHNHARVEPLLAEKGAIQQRTGAYCAHIAIVEKAISEYKGYIRTNKVEFDINPVKVHLEALHTVRIFV